MVDPTLACGPYFWDCESSPPCTPEHNICGHKGGDNLRVNITFKMRYKDETRPATTCIILSTIPDEEKKKLGLSII